MKIGNYEIVGQLTENIHTKIYIGNLDSQDKKFLLKTATNHAGFNESTLSLRNEYEISRIVDEQLFRSEIFKFEGNLVFARKFLEGCPLNEWYEIEKPDLVKKLGVAINIVQNLSVFHSKKLIHKNIHPENIIINPVNNTVNLIDFQLSSRLELKPDYLGNPQKLEGSIAYISPEQTGRMNRTVDYRADLYSIGVILYQLFTGVLPFGNKDPLEVMHGHLAKTPASLHYFRPELPKMLDNIVQKLLNKNAEDRYQSASSLAKDLQKCLDDLNALGDINFFIIAEQDKPLYFQIPEKLYGRKSETSQLMEAFQIVDQGRKILLTIGGPSGIGKSRLVKDIQIPVTLRNGFFISGKFEKIQRNTPYLAWIHALEKFVEIILTESKSSIQLWSDRIIKSLGESVGVITELVPEMEKIIGKHENPQGLSVSEDLNRFKYALRQFIKTISTPEKPLIIFLDDIQWADGDSLNLLSIILTEPGLGNLLLIASYRDNEINEFHPFSMCLEATEKDWIKINETDTSKAYASDNTLIIPIYLSSLQVSDITDMLKDTFKSEPVYLETLAEIIFNKTQGNAFFIHKFLESLYEEGLLSIVQENNQIDWQLDIDGIRNLKVTDNVMDLLKKQLNKLPTDTQTLLKIASCLGYQFELNDLSKIINKDINELEKTLFLAIYNNYIIPVDANYKYIPNAKLTNDKVIWFKFSHDRMAQTFYDILDGQEKKEIHLNAFNYFYKRRTGEEITENIFEIARHVNNTHELIKDSQLKKTVNFQAGIKAKNSAAYSVAYSYFKQAINLADENAWNLQYEDQSKLYIETAECAYLSGLYQDTEDLIDIILKYAKSPKDYGRAIELRCDSYFVQQKMQESVSVGLNALKLLGMKLPVKPEKFHVVKELVITKWNFRKIQPTDLLDFPEFNDEHYLPIMRLLSNIASPAFFTNTNLWVIIILKMVSITARKGISSFGVYALSNYAYMQCSVLGEVKKGVHLKNVLLQLLNRKSLSRYKIRSKLMCYCFIEHWETSIENTLLPLKNSFQEGLESGDSDFTSFLGNGLLQHSIMIGVDLDEVSLDLRRLLQYNTQVKNYTSRTFTEIFYQFVSCIQGETKDPSILKGAFYDPDTALKELIEGNISSILCNLYFYQTHLCALFNKAEEGIELIELVKKHAESIAGSPVGNYINYLDAITKFQGFLTTPTRKKYFESSLKKNLVKIEQISKNCKTDYSFKYILIRAFLAAIDGNKSTALDLFNQGISSIDEANNRYDKALALAVYGRYCKHITIHDLAVLKMQEAAFLFNAWGATAVADALETDCETMLNVSHKNVRLVGAGNPAGAPMVNQEIDIFSIIRGTQAISSEFDLDKLTRSLLQLMVENAGAERGILLFENQHNYCVQYEADNRGNIVSGSNTPITDYAQASTAIINYVINTGNPIILDHAHLTGRFVNDSYIQKNKIRSCLCMSIKNKNKQIGLLYLENNLISGAFTQNRIDVLNILATQATISIENAGYYNHINNLNIAYERFIPHSFLGQLDKNSILDITLGNQVSKNMTVMFSDIRNFTTISENMNASEIFSFLNEVLGLLNPVIEKHSGIIDKYIGDAIMALFPKNAEEALAAAVEMQIILNQYNQMRKSNNLFPVKMGIGLNLGPLILGTVGSENRLNTTVIGDTVNIASRLESFTKLVGANILLPAHLMDQIKNNSQFNFRHIGKHYLKGKTALFSVIEEYSSLEPQLKSNIARNHNLFDEFIKAFDKKESVVAQELLEHYIDKVPTDPILPYFKNQLHQFAIPDK